ncbi:hypothetical protein TNIN_352431, partial [Trichonephila inaurata madagascariensis]
MQWSLRLRRVVMTLGTKMSDLDTEFKKNLSPTLPHPKNKNGKQKPRAPLTSVFERLGIPGRRKAREPFWKPTEGRYRKPEASQLNPGQKK